ncbi:MAG: FAD-dependent oxidoreductase, partial [Pseudomonadota bacterium]
MELHGPRPMGGDPSGGWGNNRMSAASNETQRAERPGEQPRARPDTGRLRWPLSAQMTDWARTEPSYWADTAPLERPGVPLTEEVRVDVAIIGGGFTGLSTALSLSRDYNVSCAVLEGGEVGWGSSGRNGGLVMLDCTKLSLHEMFQRVGVSDTAKYFASQVEAVRLVQATIAEEAIDCDVVLEHGLTAATSPKRLESLRSEAALLRGTLGIDAQILNAQELQERFVDSPALHGALSVGPGMVLHPLKLAIGLARAVERRGADLYVNAPILAWEQDGGDHVLHSRHGRVRARWVTLATNGFTPDRLHSSFDGRMAPVISNIGVTRVLTRDELAAHNLQSFAPMIDDRHLLRYFRLLPDGRLLLGMRGRDTGS